MHSPANINRSPPPSNPVSHPEIVTAVCIVLAHDHDDEVWENMYVKDVRKGYLYPTPEATCRKSESTTHFCFLRIIACCKDFPSQ